MSSAVAKRKKEKKTPAQIHEETIEDFKHSLDELDQRDFNKPVLMAMIDDAVRILDNVVQRIDDGD